jgi:hypothetical protein
VNLHDHITNALRKTPMKMGAIIDFINADADVEWSSNFLTQQINTLLWRGSIVRDGKGVLSVPAKETDEPVDTPPQF